MYDTIRVTSGPRRILISLVTSFTLPILSLTKGRPLPSLHAYLLCACAPRVRVHGPSVGANINISLCAASFIMSVYLFQSVNVCVTFRQFLYCTESDYNTL